MSTARYVVEWAVAGLHLRLAEPSLEEVRASAAALAAQYNEPVNRALMTNAFELSAEEVVELYQCMWASGDRPFFLHRDGEHVGDCDFRGVEGDYAEFAILVGPRGSQAKGLGTRFALMAHALAFGPLGLQRVYISVRPENAGSLRMFQKVGYSVDVTPEGRAYAEADDDVCLSISRETFERMHRDALSAVAISKR